MHFHEKLVDTYYQIISGRGIIAEIVFFFGVGRRDVRASHQSFVYEHSVLRSYLHNIIRSLWYGTNDTHQPSNGFIHF